MIKRWTGLAVASLMAGAIAFGGARAQDQDKERYYWIASLSTVPLFLAHDYPALRAEAERLGVSIEFAGPENIDIESQNNILQQIAASNPAGILFMPFGEGHNEIINQVIADGIPLVTIDGDAPNSDRIAYAGTDWQELGKTQAGVMADLLGGEGEIMLSAIIPNDNTRKAREGIEAALADYPGIKLLGLQNDKGDVAEAARLTAAALQANPNIKGFIGIDTAAAGIARAISEAGLEGEVKVVAVNDTPDVIEAVKAGTIQATVVQKREAFEVWALRFLYEINHPSSEPIATYANLGFPMVPSQALFGAVVVDADNVDALYP